MVNILDKMYSLYINFNEVNYYPLESKNKEISLKDKFKSVNQINENIKLLNKVINKTNTTEVVKNNENDTKILGNLNDGIQLPLIWKLESDIRLSKRYGNIIKINKKGDDIEVMVNEYKEILNYKFT